MDHTVDQVQRWGNPLGLGVCRFMGALSLPFELYTQESRYSSKSDNSGNGTVGKQVWGRVAWPGGVLDPVGLGGTSLPAPRPSPRASSSRVYGTISLKTNDRWMQRSPYTQWFGEVSRSFGSAPPGADIAQKILTCEDPSQIDISLDDLTPEGLSAVARAAAVSKVTDKIFLQSLVHKATQGILQLSPVDVCNIIESFSELKYCHSIELKTCVAQFMMTNLESFSGDMLGHTLRSFANLDFYDDELLEQVLSYMAANAEGFSAENIADVVYAFSKCGFCHPDLVLLVDKAGSLLLKEVLHDKGEALSSIIDAYSRVGCTESDVVEELISRVTANPDLISVNALAKTLTAAIRLGSEDQHMINSVIASLLQKMEDLDSKLLIDIIKALGGLGFRNDKLLDMVVGQVLPQRTHELSKTDLEDVLSSLNKLGYYSRSLVSLIEDK